MAINAMCRGIMKEMELMKVKSLSPLKKTITQLLISVSIFSLVFSWSSLSSSTLPYYQNFHYFSCNLFHLRSFAMNKNCIFLICNGILVFVANTSALVRPPSGSDLDGTLQKRIGDGLQLEIETEAETLSHKHIMLDESGLSADEDDDDDDDADELEANGADEMEVEQEFEHSNNREDEFSISISINEHEEAENEVQNCWVLDTVDDRDHEESDGGEDVDVIEKLSAEELNQKFEDFIRRMKEEFRVNEY